MSEGLASDPADAVVARFTARAAVDAELAIVRVRGVLLALVLARLLAVRWDEIVSGMLKHEVALGGIVFGFAVNAALARAVRRSTRPERLLTASPLLDALVTLIVLAPAVIWPHEGYLGLLRMPDVAIWPLVAAAAGLRLSRRAAALGAAGAGLSVAGLVAIDVANGVAVGGAALAMAATVMIAAGMFAVGLAEQVRRLVSTAAHEAVIGERSRQQLGAYVSPEVAALAERGALVLGGQARDVAVLFSDLRGFTTYAADRDPDALIGELNAYFEAMLAAIRPHGGVVDKYIGDAIMVVFGVPTARGDEATRALRTAAAMTEALVGHNRERAARGLAPLRQGIGVHHGAAVAGNVGTLQRLQYTVVGDTVNTASRLEGATKDVGVDVLLSADVVERARAEGAAPAVRALEPLALRGRPGAIAVYTLG